MRRRLGNLFKLAGGHDNPLDLCGLRRRENWPRGNNDLNGVRVHKTKRKTASRQELAQSGLSREAPVHRVARRRAKIDSGIADGKLRLNGEIYQRVANRLGRNMESDCGILTGSWLDEAARSCKCRKHANDREKPHVAVLLKPRVS